MFLGDELQEVCVPDTLAVVPKKRFLAPVLEPVDGRPKQASGGVVELGRVVRVRVEQKRPCLAALFSRVDLARSLHRGLLALVTTFDATRRRSSLPVRDAELVRRR